MTMPAKDQVAEAVRERVRMADAWSKSTGYPPQDYFDVMMDLRRMLALYDAAHAALRARESEVEGLRKAARSVLAYPNIQKFMGSILFDGLMSAITYTPSPADGEEKR
jgi:DNA-binding FadR family transcriptional regulator